MSCQESILFSSWTCTSTALPGKMQLDNLFQINSYSHSCMHAQDMHTTSQDCKLSMKLRSSITALLPPAFGSGCHRARLVHALLHAVLERAPHLAHQQARHAAQDPRIHGLLRPRLRAAQAPARTQPTVYQKLVGLLEARASELQDSGVSMLRSHKQTTQNQRTLAHGHWQASKQPGLT